MTRTSRLTALGLVSALMIAVAAPMTAHAGQVTIYNDNCTKQIKGETVKRVTVRVYSDVPNCTNRNVIVHQGESVTVSLQEKGVFGIKCTKYAHEAKGTVFGRNDVPAKGNSSVTCRRDRANICQCTKD